MRSNVWSSLRAMRRDPVRGAYATVAAVWIGAMLVGLLVTGLDARSWYDYRLPDPYTRIDYASGAGFYFTPVLAFAVYPFTLLPWLAFVALWTALLFAALGYLAGRLAIVALFLPPIFWEIEAGNFALLIALAVFVGYRWRPAWSFVLLTKLTPGIALVWYVVRGEWRNLAVVAATTAILAGVTFAIAPGLWFEWWAAITANAASSGRPYFTVPVPLLVRLALGVLVVAWGGRTDRPWTLAVAATLATPVLWFNALATLVAVLPLWLATRGRVASASTPGL